MKCPKCKKERIIYTTACNTSTFTFTPINLTGAISNTTLNYNIHDTVGDNITISWQVCECKEP